MYLKKQKIIKKGFTLIELLIVVSVIGILAGAVVGLIDVNKTQDRARDGVRQANLEKVIQGLESFYVLEDYYPAQGSSGDGSNNPLLGTDSAALSTYITQWPTEEVYTYNKIDDNNFVIGTPNSSGNYYKYHSAWSGISECDSWTVDEDCAGDDTSPPTEPPEDECTIDSECQAVCSGQGYSEYQCVSGSCTCSNPPPVCAPNPCTNSVCRQCCVGAGYSNGSCTGSTCNCAE